MIIVHCGQCGDFKIHFSSCYLVIRQERSLIKVIKMIVDIEKNNRQKSMIYVLRLHQDPFLLRGDWEGGGVQDCHFLCNMLVGTALTMSSFPVIFYIL